jgi:hypothetical protein
VTLHSQVAACVPLTAPLFAFLPFALAGFATAIILGLQWSGTLFSARDQSSVQHQSLSKGADQ